MVSPTSSAAIFKVSKSSKSMTMSSLRSASSTAMSKLDERFKIGREETLLMEREERVELLSSIALCSANTDNQSLILLSVSKIRALVANGDGSTFVSKYR